jgi:hypothetical protein
MEALLDVVGVEAKPGYVLHVEFENGEKRSFDMAPYLGKRPFDRLRDSPLFFKAAVAYGTVVRPGNIDIAPKTLYCHSTPLRSVAMVPATA